MTGQYNRTFGTLYHGTSRENAHLVRHEGFMPSVRGSGGPGIYLAQTEDVAKGYGDVVIPVMLTKGTLIHPEPYEDPSVAHHVKKGHWNKIPETLAKQGWHGHVDDQGGGEHDEIVVYDPTRIKFL